MTRLQTLASALMLNVAAVPAFADAPNVVVTIPPLHGLTASIMEGVGDPTLLLEGNVSPHDYALRPSEARALQDAGLVIWIGEDLETFLPKVLEEVAGDARHLAVLEADGVRLLENRNLSDFGTDTGSHEDEHGHDKHEEEHDHGHDDHDHGHDHAHGAFDAHIWLNPANAIASVNAISAALSDLDPENAATYESNASALLADLDMLTTELTAELAPVQDKGFVVFHDAYQYFETAFGLRAKGVITLSPEQRPSAQQIRTVSDQLANAEIICAFQETQFDNRILQRLTEDKSIRIGTLDPLGSSLPYGPGHYQATLRAMAQSLVDCLAQ